MRVTGVNDEAQAVFFKTEQGEFSKPHKTPYGWHIFFIASRMKFTELDFKAEYPIYRDRCSRHLNSKYENELLEKARQKLNYKLNEKNLQEFVDISVGLRESRKGDRPLSFYVDSSILTAEQNSLALATFGDFIFTVKDFLYLGRRLFGPRGFEFANLEVAKEAVDNLSSHNLLYIYGLGIELESHPEYARQYRDTENGLVFIKYETDYIQKNSDVFEEELAEFYEENINRYRQPRWVKVSVIVAAEKNRADSISALLRGGQAFEELLLLSEHEPSKARKGDIGFTYPTAYPAIYNKAKAIRK